MDETTNSSLLSFVSRRKTRRGIFALNRVEKLLLFAFAAWFAGLGFSIANPSNDLGFRIFDILFIVFSFLMLCGSRPMTSIGLLCSFLSVVYIALDAAAFQFINNSYQSGFSNSGALMNFVYSDKYILYIILMSTCASKTMLGEKFFKYFLILFMTVLTLKYSYVLLMRIDDRPRLVVENNYEMMWLLIAVSVFSILRRREGKKTPTAYFVWMCVLIVLSGSRSVAIGIVPVALLLYLRASVTGIGATLVALPLGGIIAANVFISRTSSFEKIDRYKFFNALTDQLPRFEWYNYLIGMKPLTPLNDQTCQALSFYSSLFSSEGDGKCYSLVLHSFFMRAFFDHGILGIIVPFIMIYFLLAKSGYKRNECLCLVSLGAICGLSVSGIGTSFVAFPLAMAMAWKPAHRTRIASGVAARTNP